MQAVLELSSDCKWSLLCLNPISILHMRFAIKNKSENILDLIGILLVNSGTMLWTNHSILILHFSAVEGKLHFFTGYSMQNAEDCLSGIYSYDLDEYKGSKWMLFGV